MHKFVVLYPPQPDPEKFRSYYVETHIPLVRKLPGLQALRYSFDVQSGEGDSAFFCIFEGEFADAAAMGAAMASPEGQAAIADVPNFAHGAPTVINYPVDAKM